MNLSYKPMLRLLLVFLLILLNSSFAWSMDLEEFTHSRTNDFPPRIKALYVSESAMLITNDRERPNRSWPHPIIRAQDDGYMRLVKKAYEETYKLHQKSHNVSV